MTFIRCATCGVLRIPPDKLVQRSVPPDSSGNRSVAMNVLLRMRMRWLRREIPALRDKSARIADIGCGDGQFLQYLGATGYRRVFGIEPEQARARNARSRGVAVFASREEAEAAGAFSKDVDVLMIWHVLEHIDRPAVFLRAHTEWLAPGGCMVISVPNQRGIQTRLFGMYSAYVDYGRHLWYYNKSFVAWLRRNAPGLEVGLLTDRNIEYEIFSWVDSIGSSITRQQNFVHRALKKGEGSPVRRVTAAAAALVLLPLAVVLSPFSLLSENGSTLTFIIRRGRG